MTELSILWRRLDRPGHESGRIFFKESCWHLTGTAVFAHNQDACRLDYLVVCDAIWRTSSAKIAGWVGSQIVEIDLSVDSSQQWLLNGRKCQEVTGCVDLDLNFSPSTNLLPIRRLDLAISQEAQVKAAWLRFPSFTLELLEQRYQRTGPGSYRYESAGGRFVTDIEVNAEGFVTHYPNFWRVEEAD
jgi:uncharacterized protein